MTTLATVDHIIEIKRYYILIKKFMKKQSLIKGHSYVVCIFFLFTFDEILDSMTMTMTQNKKNCNIKFHDDNNDA
jgi:hypothetical protein